MDDLVINMTLPQGHHLDLFEELPFFEILWQYQGTQVQNSQKKRANR